MNSQSLNIARSAVVTAALFAGATAANAQDRKFFPLQPCAKVDQIGDLGFTGIECVRCTISGKHLRGEPDIEFVTEPILTGIRKGGPAEGKLQEHDVLVSIDGQLITTRAAAIQYSWLEPGKLVKVTVRRDGVLKDVEITPSARCAPVTTETLNFWRGPLVASDLLSFKTGLLQYKTLAGRGWLGLALNCPTCNTPLGFLTKVSFATYPEVAQVSPGSPADKAGLRAGDMLIAINGVSLKSPAGATAFRELKPNQQVSLLVVRDGTTLTITLTAGEAR